VQTSNVVELEHEIFIVAYYDKYSL
jgi:hypothetical protein